MKGGACLSPAQLGCLTAQITRLTGDPQPGPSVLCPRGVDRERVLLERILARPWRRSAVDAQTRADIGLKLRRAIEQDLPIEFSLPFGGYKGWRQPTCPHVDWAEVFWLDYLYRYAQRLCEIHPPGVSLSFSHTGGVLGWINQLTEAEESTYLSEFGHLLAHRSRPGIAFRLVDHAQAYGGRDAVLRLLQEREPTLPMPDPAALASARRNLRIGAHRRNAAGADAPTEEEVVRAARRCAALLTLERRRDFNKFGPRIQITHIRGPSLSLHLGSCRTACAQPWVASGFFEWRDSDACWIERLSTAPASLRSMQDIPVPVEHPLKALSPALARVRLRDARPMGTRSIEG